MELKTAEEEVDQIRQQYEILRQYRQLSQTLAPLASPPPAESDNIAHQDATQLLSSLENLKEKIDKLEVKISRFRKRMQEKDPVTDKPRYGTKTLERVVALLKHYDEVELNIAKAFGETNMIHKIRQDAAKEQEKSRALEEAEQQRIARLEAEQVAEEQQKREERQRMEEETRAQEEWDREERARLLHEARLLEQRNREQAEREWVASIQVGPDGVRQQLQVLIESTSSDSKAQTTAVAALHTIFSQIVARPEEPNFRRIRRDHLKFTQDVGRHPGGKEILIAAGFRLGMIDDVPSYISTEPDIEKEMDGWSAWYGLLKSALEIVEEQLTK